MPKNQKIIFGIIGAVILIGVASYFLFRNTSPAEPEVVGNAKPGWELYESNQNRFVIQYPMAFNDADVQPIKDIFRVYFPPATTTTNLANATVYVDVTSNDCSGWKSLGSHTKTGILPAELTVDGKAYTLRSVKEQPAGHEGYTYLYFTSANNRCYAVALLLLSRAMDTYTPATKPAAYLSESFEKTFLEIVQTFKISSL